MNCFQIIIFVTSETTVNKSTIQKYLLWIAFKLLSLWRQKQPFVIDYVDKMVVNCFQIIIFVTSETTYREKSSSAGQLWIAFKLLSLWRQKQPFPKTIISICGCELLSNYYLCDVRNNSAFQTTIWKRLWIAFKLLSLWRQKQQDLRDVLRWYSCELLSNYYLCDVRNNKLFEINYTKIVVNCFQIIIFVTSETTCCAVKIANWRLWIAFKLLSLWRQKQHRLISYLLGGSCELLSNYYLCDVRNNSSCYW